MLKCLLKGKLLKQDELLMRTNLVIERLLKSKLIDTYLLLLVNWKLPNWMLLRSRLVLVLGPRSMRPIGLERLRIVIHLGIGKVRDHNNLLLQEQLYHFILLVNPRRDYHSLEGIIDKLVLWIKVDETHRLYDLQYVAHQQLQMLLAV